MQKIIIRYFLIIMIITVGITLLGNFALQTIFSQKRAEDDASRVFSEILQRIDRNQEVIESLTINLNENYITRAKALAEMIAQNPQIIESTEKMQSIANVLNVEEVHVTDENGILSWGNVPGYYGLDFYSTDQTRPFLPALTDQAFALAQEPQPNGIEGKLFQYISVARQDKPGIVQVGVAPEILDNALSNNKIDLVISNYNVNNGMNVVAFDKNEGTVVGDSKNELIGMNYKDLEIDRQYIEQKKTSGWIKHNNDRVFAVFGQVEDYLIEVSYTEDNLFEQRKNQNIVATVSSLLLGFAIIIAIFILLKRMIINDMEITNRDLKKITNGNLDVVIDVKSTPEFVILSEGINEMVDSIRRQMDEILKQAAILQQQTARLEENNQNILSSLKYARKIQNNLLPSSAAFDETFSDYCILWEPRDVVGGDIYWMKSFDQGSILCVCDCTGHGTPGALLTMLVVTALDTIVTEETYSCPANILWELEQRLISTLNVTENEKEPIDINDGADLCILYIKADGEIVLSSAKLHVFVCDGQKVENIRGQKLSIGDGSLKNMDQIKTVTIPASKDNAYYIVSDGLFEQVGGEGSVPFGYSRFKQIILENHGLPQTEIAETIWKDFEAYMDGENRRDDVTLVSFRL